MGGLICSFFVVSSSADQTNTHRRNGVNVLGATHGRTLVPINDYSSSPARMGNVTAQVAAACQGQKTCTFTVGQDLIGDPAYGCWKSFDVLYQCAENGNATATVSIPAAPGGADNQTVVMSCPIQ